MERLLKSRLEDGKFRVSPERSRSMAAVRGQGNKTTELRLQMGLVRAGISGWTTQRRDLPGKPDFFLAWLLAMRSYSKDKHKLLGLKAGEE
jgi:hypothetical protein